MSQAAEIDFLRNLPRPDTIIGRRFRLGPTIGTGGMNAVFLARDQRLERDVAFKILSPALAGSREVVARFVNEARTLARLDSEHVVRVLDCGVTNEPDSASLPYMVLELLRGDDLRTELERGAIAPERALSWILQACEGLAAAHAEGVIHRDLKPENLFLCAKADGSEVVKLLDFGIARSLVVPSALTLSGEGVGSPGYMSPEQLRDARAADERSDIWSLGVVMYELLSGVPPFQAAKPFDLCAQILAGKFPRLQQFRPELPRGLVAVVHRCLAVDPVNRFENVFELAVALAPFAEGGVESVVRIRHLLRAHNLGELAEQPLPGAGARAPAEPAVPANDTVVASARSRRPRAFASALAGLSLVAVLALLSRALGPSSHAAHLTRAQASVERVSERVSAAAQELLRPIARASDDELRANGRVQEGSHR
ncbi:MAG TPA: serine/threonine-protein kinase [Polyangiaceae bacterium]|nr:serine/threonine-protein kinase [Polyangiaceae bacterium]